MNTDLKLDLLVATALNTRAVQMLDHDVPPEVAADRTERLAWKRQHLEQYVKDALNEALFTVQILRALAGGEESAHPSGSAEPEGT